MKKTLKYAGNGLAGALIIFFGSLYVTSDLEMTVLVVEVFGLGGLTVGMLTIAFSINAVDENHEVRIKNAFGLMAVSVISATATLFVAGEMKISNPYTWAVYAIGALFVFASSCLNGDDGRKIGTKTALSYAIYLLSGVIIVGGEKLLLLLFQ